MKINGVNFQVGADPEIFVKSKATGMFASAHGLIPGTKYEPYKVNKGAVQVDGLALEFNIDPSSSFEEFDFNLDTVMSILQDMVPGYEFMDGSSVIFDEKFLETIPKEALVIGCEADYNAYTLADNPKPPEAALMRTTGGHVHVGGFTATNEFSPVHFNTSARLARILDETIGLPSLLWDKDDVRRQMYGKGGCFRPKKYGMEYRTLSNKWIFNKKVRQFVYQGVEEALKLMFNADYEPDTRIRDVLDNSDRKNELFKTNKYVLQAEKQLGFELCR